MPMPAVSIILPLYNGRAFIKHMISAVRAQDFQDWELLIINDGSCDHGEEIAERAARRDPRIQVFHKPNGGISSARNYGLCRASGAYIAFADQDDTVGKRWLSALYSGMAGDIDLAAAGKKLTIQNAAGRAAASKVYRYRDAVLATDEERYRFLFNQDNDAASHHVWSCMYRKELIDTYGIRFDENLSMGMEDVLFNICYGYYCKRIHKIPQVVYSYQKRAGISTSAKYNPDTAKEYAYRMQVIARLFGFSASQDGSRAYAMYADYALRELCNLYVRSHGPDSPKLLAGLRDAYVENVPEKAAGFPGREYFGRGYFGRERFGGAHFDKERFGRELLKRGLYAAADGLLRKENYVLLRLLKNGADICWQFRNGKGRTDGAGQADQ